MIIDCHTHVGFRKADGTFPKLLNLLNAMERTGVKKACIIISPEAAKSLFWNESEIKDAINAVVDMISKYRDKFFCFVWLNPALSEDFNIRVAEKYIVNGPIDGVKLSIQMNARDRRLEPLMHFFEDYDIPVLFHSWYKTVNKYTYESDPSDIADLALRFPNLRILMAHLTGCGQRGIQDIKEYENIFIDTSGSQPEDGFLEYAIDQLGANRILFGSDFAVRDMSTQLARIFSVDMNNDIRERILYKNADSFFKKGDREQ